VARPARGAAGGAWTVAPASAAPMREGQAAARSAGSSRPGPGFALPLSNWFGAFVRTPQATGAHGGSGHHGGLREHAGRLAGALAKLKALCEAPVG